MARSRISVNFSKKYEKEYKLILNEDNASELICELLRKHYEGDITNKDIMNRIEDLLSSMKIDNIDDKDLDDAIDCW